LSLAAKTYRYCSWNTNDYLGKLSQTKLIIKYQKKVMVQKIILLPGNNFYMVQRLGSYINGKTGEQFCVKILVQVVEGIGDHGCEYMSWWCGSCF
jgi:glutamate synthase domain-containing protein 3